MKRIKYIVIFSFVCCFVIGCSKQTDQDNSRPVKPSGTATKSSDAVAVKSPTVGGKTPESGVNKEQAEESTELPFPSDMTIQEFTSTFATGEPILIADDIARTMKAMQKAKELETKQGRKANPDELNAIAKECGFADMHTMLPNMSTIYPAFVTIHDMASYEKLAINVAESNKAGKTISEDMVKSVKEKTKGHITRCKLTLKDVETMKPFWADWNKLTNK